MGTRWRLRMQVLEQAIAWSVSVWWFWPRMAPAPSSILPEMHRRSDTDGNSSFSIVAGLGSELYNTPRDELSASRFVSEAHHQICGLPRRFAVVRSWQRRRHLDAQRRRSTFWAAIPQAARARQKMVYTVAVEYARTLPFSKVLGSGMADVSFDSKTSFDDMGRRHRVPRLKAPCRISEAMHVHGRQQRAPQWQAATDSRATRPSLREPLATFSSVFFRRWVDFIFQ